MFDCRTVGQHKKWSVGKGCEVERVVWDHFNPHRLLASNDKGGVVCVDLRQDSKPVWTLSAHSDAVTGLSLSSQCPGCMVTVSQDKVLKVWDVAGDSPEFVVERDVKLGQLHASASCPDAPFVVSMGGDKSSDNFKVTIRTLYHQTLFTYSICQVWDIRENAPVRSKFGQRKHQNPLKTAEFGFATPDEAEPAEDMETDMGLGAMSIKDNEGNTIVKEENKKPAFRSNTGGAAGKFQKKEKKKKSKIKNF